MRLIACFPMLQVARDLFKVSLYLFRGASLSRWPVDNSPYSTVFGRRWSKLCFEEHGLDADNLSHFKDLDVGDEVTPMDV